MARAIIFRFFWKTPSKTSPIKAEVPAPVKMECVHWVCWRERQAAVQLQRAVHLMNHKPDSSNHPSAYQLFCHRRRGSIWLRDWQKVGTCREPGSKLVGFARKSTFAVSGQDTIVADSNSDTVTLAGSGTNGAVNTSDAWAGVATWLPSSAERNELYPLLVDSIIKRGLRLQSI